MSCREIVQTAVRDACLRSCAASTALHSAAIMTLALVAFSVQSGTGDQPTLHARIQGPTDLPEPLAPRLDSAPVGGGPAEMAEAVLTGGAQSIEVSPPQLAMVSSGTGAGASAALQEFSSKSDQSVGSGSAKFYGIEAAGTSFVYVVDQSGSMRGARFRRARAELERSVRSLDERQEYFIVFFNVGATPMPTSGMVPATTANVRDTSRWIDRVECQGDTYPASALLLALQLDPDAIFFLTDGQFDPSAAAVVRRPEGYRVPVHTIGFTNRDSAALLEQIAEETGGTYRFVR